MHVTKILMFTMIVMFTMILMFTLKSNNNHEGAGFSMFSMFMRLSKLVSFCRQIPCFFRELVAILHERKVPVYLVSGGFDILIKTVAKELHIPSENIFANRLLFYYDGNYTVSTSGLSVPVISYEWVDLFLINHSKAVLF